MVHLLMLACLRGLAVRGPIKAGRQHAYVAGPRLARPAAQGRSDRRHWPSSPAATWSATGRRTIATSRGGRACRCATPAPASRRSPPSSSSATTAWSRWPAASGRASSPPRPARAVRPGPARLVPHARRSSAPTSSWSPQRPLPPLRDGRGAGGRDLAIPEGEGRDRAARADPRRSEDGARGRRRRRRALLWGGAAALQAQEDSIACLIAAANSSAPLRADFTAKPAKSLPMPRPSSRLKKESSVPSPEGTRS